VKRFRRHYFRIEMPNGPDPVIFVRASGLVRAWFVAQRYFSIAFPEGGVLHYLETRKRLKP